MKTLFGTKLNKSCLVFLTCVCLVYCATAQGEEQLPAVVQTYVDGVQQGLNAEVARMNSEHHFEIRPGYSLKFWQQTVDYRDGSSPAWLVGYDIGTMKIYPVSVAALIDANGHEIIRFPSESRGGSPDDGQYDDGVSFDVSPGKHAVALSRYPIRDDPGGLQILSLEAAPKELLNWETPRDPAWSSQLYFVDVDSDGKMEILIEREVLFFAEKRKQTLNLLYRFDEQQQRFVQSLDLDEAQITERIAAAKINPSVLKIKQPAPIYDPSIWSREDSRSLPRQ